MSKHLFHLSQPEEPPLKGGKRRPQSPEDPGGAGSDLLLPPEEPGGGIED